MSMEESLVEVDKASATLRDNVNGVPSLALAESYNLRIQDLSPACFQKLAESAKGAAEEGQKLAKELTASRSYFTLSKKRLLTFPSAGGPSPVMPLKALPFRREHRTFVFQVVARRR